IRGGGGEGVKEAVPMHTAILRQEDNTWRCYEDSTAHTVLLSAMDINDFTQCCAVTSWSHDHTGGKTVRLRLKNGGSPCAGRLEIHYKGQWGTVDDYEWDLADSAVVCRELDCGTAVSAPRGAHFGRGSGPIVIMHVECSGTERALRYCQSASWDRSSISHDNDAGVVCS
ncbi:hypothetical protein chiPu_0022781, partial [Chiloscyllium punctatum]|nr:hypothetical protein [Chiloscyllium punctatum]